MSLVLISNFEVGRTQRVAPTCHLRPGYHPKLWLNLFSPNSCQTWGFGFGNDHISCVSLQATNPDEAPAVDDNAPGLAVGEQLRQQKKGSFMKLHTAESSFGFGFSGESESIDYIFCSSISSIFCIDAPAPEKSCRLHCRS